MGLMFRKEPVRVGDRVVVRSDTEVIGVVTSLDPLTLNGDIVIPEYQVMKKLSPKTVMNRDIRAIEQATAKAFPGAHQEWTSDGQWLMRAGDGIAERSNSAAPLGPSARFVPIPWDEINEFYRRHNLPTTLLIPERIAPNPNVPMGPEIIVMTRNLENLPEQAEGFELLEKPDQQWLDLYHFRGQPLPADALELRPIDGEMGFGRLVRDGQTVAVTRGTITDGYLGYSAVEVAEKYRRQGLGTALGVEMLRWARQKGAHTAYLQVIADNVAGIGLYHKLGFVEHHRHRYTR
ncbi:GNAT family N-acetyltransferase [Corynebacterium sp. 35RC1]|nr:GNAT family N-acetyltransferase [Corynebacterium sp. 35RC1]